MQQFMYGQFKGANQHTDLYLTAKRALDLVLGVVLGIALLPVIACISVVLYFLFRKNPFYTQQRAVSLETRDFTIIKFRTMYDDQSDADHRDFILKRKAQEIPAFCAWMRITGLDELPQLINVLKGDMSFIGPRPLSLSDLQALQQFYPEAYNVRAKITAKAGVSGFWQVFGDRKLGVDNLVSMDREYSERRSFTFDLYLIWKTIPVMLLAEHSDAILGERGSKDKRTSPDSNPDVFVQTCTVKNVPVTE